MKLRVVQVFDAEVSPWFRLQEWRDNEWRLISCGSDKHRLVEAMHRIAQNDGPVVIAEVST
jgi:hypothetical protein